MCGLRHTGGVTRYRAVVRNVGTCRRDAKRESQAETPQGESIDARHRGGTARSSEEASVTEVERRGCVTRLFLFDNQRWEERIGESEIIRDSKETCVGSVSADQEQRRSCWIDGQTIEGFEESLKDNLYKLWNRMSSGSYFPSAVRRVEIPKKVAASGRWEYQL